MVKAAGLQKLEWLMTHATKGLIPDENVRSGQLLLDIGRDQWAALAVGSFGETDALSPSPLRSSPCSVGDGAMAPVCSAGTKKPRCWRGEEGLSSLDHFSNRAPR